MRTGGSSSSTEVIFRLGRREPRLIRPDYFLNGFPGMTEQSGRGAEARRISVHHYLHPYRRFGVEKGVAPGVAGVDRVAPHDDAGRQEQERSPGGHRNRSAREPLFRRCDPL